MAYPYGPYPSCPYGGWYQTPYYFPPQPGTPFVPNLSLYNSSPWARTSPLPPVSPYLPSPSSAPASVPFPTEAGDGKYSGNYVSLGNVATPMRDRRPSLHASPWSPPTTLPTTGHVRRHSFNAGTPSHWEAHPDKLYLNPWMDGEAPRIDFDFDLSKPKFSAYRLYGGGRALELQQTEMNQPATYPSIYKLRIVSDEVPQWPIELQWNAQPSGLFSPPSPSHPPTDRPVLLSDVLLAIHSCLQLPIKQGDYDRLNNREKEAVGQAYRARCSAAGTYLEQEAERQQGIKRIDFFGKKKRFVGLTRIQPSMGWEIMKLHTR